jgi:uncharacterized membrane protein
VKWNYADKRLGFILFCIGYGIVIVVLPIMLIILIFLIIEHRRHRQEKRNSSEHSYCLNETILKSTS